MGCGQGAEPERDKIESENVPTVALGRVADKSVAFRRSDEFIRQRLAPTMVNMVGTVGSAVGAQRAREVPGLRLLRADLMPVMVSVFNSHFTDRRTWPYSEFLTLLVDDLDELRDAGFTLPRTAQEYLHDWIKDGLLIRRATTEREETVELSRSTADAVRFVLALDRPRSAVTSSRLANLAELLGSLARDSDPVPTRRIEALRAQLGAIQAEIDKLAAGELEPLAAGTARERLTEILRLAEEVPGDFAKVADDLERLNQSLRERIINHEGPRGGVLDEIFNNVDLIENSDAGRTFTAFHTLLMDVELVDSFDESVDAVLDREFTADLDGTDAAFLRRFLTTLQRESKQVRDTLTGLSRSLRRFVETQEYREHRRLADALARAEQAAMAAVRVVPPTREIGRDIDLTSIAIASVASWALHNPGELRVTAEVSEHEIAPLDLEQLRELVRLTEIDFPELQRNIVQALEGRSTVTVGEVLEQSPASQGLASVIGLYVLAIDHATRADGVEDWSWLSSAGALRTVSGPRYLFSHLPEWLAGQT